MEKLRIFIKKCVTLHVEIRDGHRSASDKPYFYRAKHCT